MRRCLRLSLALVSVVATSAPLGACIDDPDDHDGIDYRVAGSGGKAGATSGKGGSEEEGGSSDSEAGQGGGGTGGTGGGGHGGHGGQAGGGNETDAGPDAG
jgi:hypothetical protein